MSTPDPAPAPTPTPQPVLTAGVIQAGILKLLLAVVIITRYTGWWSPSVDDLTILAAAAAEITSDAILVWSWFTHNRTTPTVKVALTTDQAAGIEALAAKSANVRANDVGAPVGTFPPA